MFVAPCSHTWHYKCIRVIINGPHWPHFICPNCRNIADLEAEIEEIHTESWEEIKCVNELSEKGNINDLSIDKTESVNEIPESNSAFEQTDSGSKRPRPVDVPIILNHESHSGIAEDSDDQQINEAAYRLDRIHTDVSSGPSSLLYLEPSDSGVAPAITIPRQQSRGKSSDQNISDNTQNISGIHFLDSHNQQEPPVGAEGPMTPRNNVGPYLFDGSSGDIQNTDITSMNLVRTPETPLDLSALKDGN